MNFIADIWSDPVWVHPSIYDYRYVLKLATFSFFFILWPFCYVYSLKWKQLIIFRTLVQIETSWFTLFCNKRQKLLFKNTSNKILKLGWEEFIAFLFYSFEIYIFYQSFSQSQFQNAQNIYKITEIVIIGCMISKLYKSTNWTWYCQIYSQIWSPPVLSTNQLSVSGIRSIMSYSLRGQTTLTPCWNYSIVPDFLSKILSIVYIG